MYEVYEYDIFPGVLPKRNLLTLKIDATNIRCLNHKMHHEQLVAGSWFILEPIQFETIIKDSRNVTITRKAGSVQTRKLEVQKPLISRIRVTDHATTRIAERFSTNDTSNFFKRVLKDHKIIQGAQFYNTHRNHLPTDLYICNLEHNVIVSGSLRGGLLIVKTLFEAKECKWFQNWFQDNLDTFHKAPTLDQFFHGKSK